MGSSRDNSYKQVLVLSSSLHADLLLVRAAAPPLTSPGAINTQHPYLCIPLQNAIEMQITSIAVQPRNWFRTRQRKEREAKSGLQYVCLRARTRSGSRAS